MNSKNELIILKIIKYTPPIFIITLSILISFTLYINNQTTFNEEKRLIEKEHIVINKELIKKQIDNIYEYIIYEQERTEKRLKDNLKEKVYDAYKIAMNIYEENKHLDKKIVEKMIKDAIRTIRFNNGRGYFFIYSLDYECILLPIAAKIEGKNFYNFKDGKGTYLTRDIVELVKRDKEGYLKWWYHKPSDMKNQYEKLGFNKLFEPFNWFIGTGEYIEDFENDIKKDVLKHIQNSKYTNNGYVFTIDSNGKVLTHIKKEIIGFNVNNLDQTEDNKYIFDTISNLKNDKSKYFTYIQKIKPGTNKAQKKTSYLKNISSWGWVIGKGFYTDETNIAIQNKKNILDKRLEDSFHNLIIMTLVLTAILILISIWISKILEKRFKDYREEINLNINELTKQQNILAQQSKMAAVGEMIANIAHQWRQPLSLISTVSTGMKIKKEMGVLDDQEFSKNLQYINDSTQYLSKTIDDFRNFFASDKEEKEFSLKNALDNSLNIVGIQFKNKDIKIIKEIDDIKTIGIESELIQVFINILNNSRDELIKVENKKRLILIKIYKRDNDKFIEIQDNAGGIDESILQRVFEPHFTTKAKNKGTGIGLYMSEQIVSKHLNGEISIDNNEFQFEDVKYKGALTVIKLH